MSRRPHPALGARRRTIARARGRRRRTVVLAGVVLAAMVAGGWWLATGPALAPRDVRVSGYDRDDRALLERALELAAARGSVLVPARAEMEAVAAQFPWIERIVVGRHLPLGLSVAVVPVVPAAVAAPRAGDPVLVAPDGRVLGPAPKGAGLPWLRIPGQAPAVGETLPERAQATLSFALAADPDLAPRLRALTLEPGGMTGRLAHGPRLRIGPPDRLGDKARSLAAVVHYLSDEDERAATYVDLTAPERPAVGGLASEGADTTLES